jgi:hypothetical protein
MLGTCFSFLVHIGTSCLCLLRVGFFAVDLLFVVCGCGEHLIHSRDHSKLRGGLGFGLTHLLTGIKG